MLIFVFNQVVGNIEVYGLKYHSKNMLLNNLGIRTNKPFPFILFKNYLYSLYIQGFLDTLEVYEKSRNDTIDLLFKVSDYPIINNFKWEIKKPSKEIEDSLAFFKGLPASDYNKFKIAKMVERYFVNKGYVNPKIEISQKFLDNSRVELIVKGNIGNKYRISKIEFYGNKNFSSKLLKNLMSNKEVNTLRRILRGGYFSEVKFQKDLKTIEELYKNNGFPDFKIDSFNFEYEANFLKIKIFLNEGKKYYFGSVEYDGNKKFSNDELNKVITIKKPLNFINSIKYKLGYGISYNPNSYSRARVLESLSNISALYSDSGYIYAQIEPIEEKRDSFIDIKFKIKENWKVKVRLVNIVGNTKTWDEIIRRELYIFPGDYFNRSLLLLSYRNLYYLNYFSNINVNFKPVIEDSSLIDLEIKVEEKPTGQFGAGASYSQLDGLFFNVNLQQPNFLGRGWTIGVLAEYGVRRQNYQLSFTEPWFGGKPVLVGVNIYSLNRYLFTFSQRNTGISLSYGRRLWDLFSKIRFDYTFEYISVYDISSLYEGTQFYDFWTKRDKVLSSSLTTTFSYDTRDRIFNPSRGYFFNFPYTLTGGPIGGNLHYVKLMPELSFLVPNYKDKLISFFRISWGSIFSILSKQELPPYEYFALGDIGPLGLRGYSFRSIGTKIGNSILGGRHFFRITFEERIRPTDQFYISLFYEAGNSWWSLKTIDWNLYDAVGVGFRIEVPIIGIMGFDFAYSLKYKQFQTHFALGPYY
ncbi:MAG: outer membrane protein assembly factor BamA [candidate division WOR-3 bacterium]